MSTSTRRSPRRIITGLIATAGLALASFGFTATTAAADTGDICDICSISFDVVACDAAGRVQYDSTEQHPDGTPLFPDPTPTQTPKPTQSPKPTPTTTSTPRPSPTVTAKPTAAPKPSASTPTGSGSNSGSGSSTGSGSNGSSIPSGSTSTGSTSNDAGTSTNEDLDDVINEGEELTGEDIAVDEDLDTDEIDGPTIVAIEGDLIPGNEVVVRGEGFPTDAVELRVEIHSVPQVIGLADTNADGSFALTAIVPEDLEPGWHQLVVFADDVEIARTSVVIAAPSEEEVETVAASSDEGGSSAAGLALLGGLVVAGGGAVAFHTLRKRKEQTAA